jgi:hypothetical protein
VQAELEQKGGEIGFGEEVVAVEAVLGENGLESDVKLLKVTSRNLKTGDNVARFTRNLVLSTGGSPRVPQALTHDDIVATGRVIHTSEFLDKIRPILSKLASPLPVDRPLKVAVFGSGQVSLYQGQIYCFLTFAQALISTTVRSRDVPRFQERDCGRPAESSRIPSTSQLVYPESDASSCRRFSFNQ